MERPLAIEELLSHAGWLRRLAAGMARDGASADDLVQETWMAALRRPPRALARPWLAHVMRNLARNARRTDASRAVREDFAREERESPPPEALLQEAEAQRLLAEAVTELDEPLRAIVVLRYFRGLDSSAIAAELALTPSTVRTRLAKALGELRARLDRRFPGGREAWCLALGVLHAPAGVALAPMLAAPGSSKLLAWTGATLLVVGGGFTLWSLLNQQPTRGQSALDVALAAPASPAEDLRLEHSEAGPRRAELAPRPAHTATPRVEKTLHFPTEVLVGGRAPSEPIYFFVDGWPEPFDANDPAEKNHLVLTTHRVGGGRSFQIGPLPEDWSGRLRAEGYRFEDGREWLELGGPSRPLVLRLAALPEITGRIVEPRERRGVANAGFEYRLEVRENGSVLSSETHRNSCDAEGRFRIRLGNRGTTAGALLFELPGSYRRSVTLAPFLSERGLELGDIALEPARSQRFRLLDPAGAPIENGGAMACAAGALGRASPTDADGFGELPALANGGSEVCFFGARHRPEVRVVEPGELVEVRLARASCLEVQVLYEGSVPAGIQRMRAVLKADEEPFAAVRDDLAIPAVGSSWSVSHPLILGGKLHGVELHYELAAGGLVYLEDLLPGVPLEIEVRDTDGRVLGASRTLVGEGEWQRLELALSAQPDPKQTPGVPGRR